MHGKSGLVLNVLIALERRFSESAGAELALEWRFGGINGGKLALEQCKPTAVLESSTPLS